MLSDDAKNTIDLVSKLNNGQKFMPTRPNQVYSIDDTSLYAHASSTSNKKAVNERL